MGLSVAELSGIHTALKNDTTAVGMRLSANADGNLSGIPMVNTIAANLSARPAVGIAPPNNAV